MNTIFILEVENLLECDHFPFCIDDLPCNNVVCPDEIIAPINNPFLALLITLLIISIVILKIKNSYKNR